MAIMKELSPNTGSKRSSGAAERVVRAGVIGCGAFGSSILAQAGSAPLLEIPAVADRSVDAARRAYARIGVGQAVSLLHSVRDLFPDSKIPDDYDERMAVVEGIYERHADLLDRLEGDFYRTDVLMEQQLGGWIRVHKDVFTATHAA